MSFWAAQGLCLLLVAADLIARAYRIKWLLAGLGQRITFGEAFTLNAFGEAACAITPMRIGGEPARLGGMLQYGVPATAAFVGISVEVLAAWPIIILCAGALAVAYAPEWWAIAGPHLAHGLRRAWPWVALVAVVSVLAWGAARRVGSPAVHQLRRPIRRVVVYWRRMPWWPVAASIPMTLVNLGARVAILPILVAAVPGHPPLGPVAFGSFALLYSQLVLPTPSGAGAVELGFLGGAAGELGDSGGWVLVAWRLYTTGIGALLGIWLAARIYGWPALRRLAAGFGTRLAD